MKVILFSLGTRGDIEPFLASKAWGFPSRDLTRNFLNYWRVRRQKCLWEDGGHRSHPKNNRFFNNSKLQ